MKVKHIAIAHAIDTIPWMQRYLHLSTILLAVFYAVGLIGHGIDQLLPYMLILTPYTILMTLVLVFLPHVVIGNSRLLLWILITAVFTLFLEIVGVKTGLVFGDYLYGKTLGLGIMGVPLIIGLNWVMVVLGAITFMERFTSYLWYKVAGAALITTLFDFVMEPVAMELDYWNWTGGTIPLQNYIAWAVISALCALLYEKMQLSNREHMQVWMVMVIQFLFFVGLRIVL